MSSAVSQVRSRIAAGLPYLAWASFGLATIGGALLPGTKVGKTLIEILDSFTWPVVPAIVLAALTVGVVLDIVRDLIPDRVAIYAAALGPTLAASVTGGIAEKITEWSAGLADWATGWLTEQSGIDTASGISALSLVLAYVIAKRVTKDRRSMKGGLA